MARNPHRLHRPTQSKNRRHLWYSGKHKAFGASIQVMTDAVGYPVWVSPVALGSTHNLTVARQHAYRHCTPQRIVL